MLEFVQQPFGKKQTVVHGSLERHDPEQLAQLNPAQLLHVPQLSSHDPLPAHWQQQFNGHLTTGTTWQMQRTRQIRTRGRKSNVLTIVLPKLMMELKRPERSVLSVFQLESKKTSAAVRSADASAMPSTMNFSTSLAACSIGAMTSPIT